MYRNCLSAMVTIKVINDAGSAFGTHKCFDREFICRYRVFRHDVTPGRVIADQGPPFITRSSHGNGAIGGTRLMRSEMQDRMATIRGD
jgi:hypothetical protein